MIKKSKILVSVITTSALALSFSGCGSDSDSGSSAGESGITAEQKVAVLSTYADIALANYTDALSDAKALATAIDAMVAGGATQAELDAAKTAWLTSRDSYGTTEIFRLSNGPIDAEDGFGASFGAPEGQLNAWPLDENMIDYTLDSTQSLTSGNIIDSTGNFTPSGDDASAVDVTNITTQTLASLNENGGEANVATGYHAVEFLLWGQDQDYELFINDNVTQGALVAGERPLTDFTTANNANRRLAYLDAASDLIVEDLQTVVDAWTAGAGSYREALLGEGANAIETDAAIKDIFSGMGVFIKSELANERMAVAALTPSEEDEHSCFSDNTHVDVQTNYQGFVNVLKGEYKGASMGTSFYSLLEEETQTTVDEIIADIDTNVDAIVSVATTSEHFDYQIRTDSANRMNIVNAKNDMRDLGDAMVDVASDFDISLSEDDVTDSGETQI